jgi:hypothetical protein
MHTIDAMSSGTVVPVHWERIGHTDGLDRPSSTIFAKCVPGREKTMNTFQIIYPFRSTSP